MSKEYTLVFGFTHDMKEIILMQRDKQPYRGLYNGLGGKVERNEMPFICALREFREESGLVCGTDFCTMVNVDLFKDKASTVHAYAVLLEEGAKANFSPETKWIKFHNVKNVLENMDYSQFAGGGNVQPLIQKSMDKLQKFVAKEACSV